MKKILNNLFIFTEDLYSFLDGENIVLKKGEEIVGRYPLHMLQGIFNFSYAGASPALMGECAKRNINYVSCTPRGRFLGRFVGKTNGNVLLRREQYRIADDIDKSYFISKNFIVGKIFNSIWVLKRFKRNHSMIIDENKFDKIILELEENVDNLLFDKLIKLGVSETKVNSLDVLRGVEGTSANLYFSCFDNMILSNKDWFYFTERNRRPPLDNVNALLSFLYMVLATDCFNALEVAGLDSYVGFLHRDRPGRKSLALDLMEELRPIFVDRFVLMLINNRIIQPKHFLKQENGAVFIEKDGKKVIVDYWQKQRMEKVVHPFLKETIYKGMIPYIQALLLARYIRGDIDEYPPFLWKG